MLERHQKIMKLLEQYGYLSVKELSSRVFVSEPTMRRDLEQLTSEGLVNRIHGGARIASNEHGEMPLTYSLKSEVRNKHKIAEIAAEFVQPRDSIFMTASSANLFMIPLLARKPEITIFTDGLLHAQTAAEYGITSFCTGGYVNAKAQSCDGQFLEDFIQTLHINTLFFSSPCVSVSGDIMHYSMEKVRMIRLLLTQCHRSILLCNNEKFNGRTESFTVCSTRDIDYIICDTALPDSLPLSDMMKSYLLKKS